MKKIMFEFKRAVSDEAPIVRIYLFLFLIGVFLGVLGIILLRNDFSEQIHLVFDQRMDCSFFELFFHRILILTLLFMAGLAFIGLLFSTFFPVYNGFSFGILIALASLCYGLRGFFVSLLSYMVPCFLTVFWGYFLCVSSLRLSVTLLDSFRGRGKHCSALKQFKLHLKIFLFSFPVAAMVSLWDWKIVPFFLKFL